MKLSNILTGILLIISSVAFAQSASQDSLNEYYSKYPKEALQDAADMYQKAVKEHNGPLLIKSLILKTSFSIRINYDEYPQLLKELENYIEKEKDVATRSILNSYMAELYNQYYKRNSYKINQRSELTGPAPENIASWSSNIFKEKIFSHILASIASQQILQKTPVSAYNQILIKGAASDSLRPTLYDFLAHRAIDLLQFSYRESRGIADSLSVDILSEADVFMKLPITAKPLDASRNILRIWQDLLRFRQEAGNTNAFLMADLERLESAWQMSRASKKDRYYLATLQGMKQKYSADPMVVEVLAKEAELLLMNSYSDTPLRVEAESNKATKEKVLALCEDGIRRFPRYNRINILWTIIERVKAPQINMEFPKSIYPGEALHLKVTSKNISSANISLYRVKMKITDYMAQRNKKGAVIEKALVSQRDFPLVSDLASHDTTLSLKVPGSGLYEVVMKVKGAKIVVSDYFISSQIFTTELKNEKQLLVEAYDWQSGQPVKNAKVLIYKRKNMNFTTIDSVFTNSQGQAIYRNRNNTDLFYQIINANNPVNYLQATYRNYISNPSENCLQLITDRKIYRPGQTVYFKGITWKATTDTLYALNNQKYEVIFRDANYKEIAKQTFTSNSFGSFSGSFVIPQQTLNGNFTLNAKGGRTNIVVADYKRPEFEITLTTPRSEYYTDDDVRVTGKVNSFSGVAVANTTVNYEISGFSYFYWQPEVEHKMQGVTQTNAKGEFELQFVAKALQLSTRNIRPFAYRVTVTVTDNKGETQQSTLTIPVYTGIAKPVIDIPQEVNKNKRTAFRISLENLPAQAKSRMVKYSISKLVTPTSLSAKLDTIIEKTILEGQLEVNQKDSLMPDLNNFASGAYLFTAECDHIKEAQIFYLYSLSDKRPPVPTYSWLVKEKVTCRPGEQAKILFGTSVKDAYVKYEIYTSNKLLLQKNVVLSNEIIPIDIPYLSGYGNEVWVYITYVKNKKYIQEIVPIYRIQENRILTIETKVFRDNLQPGQSEQWEIKVLDAQKQPANAEVLAMMYDASLDKLYPYDLNFRPEYLYMDFAFRKNIPYNFESKNYLGISSRGFKSWQLKYPAFQFDELNLFEPIYYIRGANVIKSLTGEYVAEDAAAPTVQLRTSKAVVTGINEHSPLEVAEVELRQDFQETAFFYPQLRTDSSGTVNIKFKIPQSLTKWKFIALANNQDMASGQLERYITTSKPLMVRPNLPRFLRSGDQAELKVTISNLSDSLQQGVSTLELFTPGNNQVFFSQQESFSVGAGESQTLSFSFTVPEQTDLAGCRITAVSGHFSDGEQSLLPVLPNEILVTETLPIYTTQGGAHSFTLENKSKSRQDYRLTLELTSNPIWYAVLALPTLTQAASPNVTEIASAFYVNTIARRIVRANPKIAETIRNWHAAKDDPTLLSKLEQNSELKAILLSASPWVMQAQSETERMQTLVQLFDQNRLEYLQQESLKKLAELQTADGGWSWFKGMFTSRFMTANVLTIMARASSTGEMQYGEKEKMMQIEALRYLDKEIVKDFESSPKRIGYEQIIYLYTRSLYRDIPLGDALQAHKHFMSLAQKQWSGFSFYDKALISVAMNHYGFSTEAKSVLKSLREYAVTSAESGMYWPNNRNESYRNSAVLVHTAIMEAFQTIEGNSKDIDLMKQWLLRQKQVQSWGSVPATVDAIYALLLTGKDQLAQQEHLTVKLGKHHVTTPDNSNPLGYIKESFSGGEIKRDMLTVKIDKKEDSPTWGGLYLQYFEKIDQIKEQQTDLGVNKQLYIAQLNEKGKQELIPLNQQAVKIGDKVVVRLTLTVKRDMEFLYLKDLRAACFEPVEQLSGNHWQFGSVYYQEVKDAATNFFFHSLSRGTYVIEYPVWVNQAGVYQDGIATFQSFYAPEVNSYSKAARIEVKNEK